MLIYVGCLISIVAAINGDNDSDLYAPEDASVNDIANTLIHLFGVDDENIKIKELKEKLKKIDSYVVDRDKYSELLVNETTSTSLNNTNFYNALNESDHFKFLLSKNEPKNLYLKLKEKMNRDDIMNILAVRGPLEKSARKMMDNKYFGKKGNRYGTIDMIVDKMIAKTPTDNHKFDYKDEDNQYWDPQGELEDLKEFHQHDGRRIFKGERTTIKYYPFMVSVHVMGRFWCGGVIYKNDIVLTSAACLQLLHNNRFFRENPSVLRVRVGSNHSRIGGEMVEALEVYFHPGYNSRTLRHNIAIIRLRRHLFFDYHRVPKMIGISHDDGGIAPTSEVLVLGWGVTKMTQRIEYEPIFLNRKFLPVYPNVFCKEVYGSKFITSTMFCAGTFTTGEGACDHDAGGPAVIAGRLVGIISFGPTVCGFPNAPTVFTLVGAYADWIENIDENMPRYYQAKKRTTTDSPFFMFPQQYVKKKTNVLPLTTAKAAELTVAGNGTGASGTTTEPALRKRKKVVAQDSDGWSIEMVDKF